MTPDEARQVLGLAADATLDDAVRRHRSLQRRHHPDVVGHDDPGATARSASLNRALAVLRDTMTDDGPDRWPGPGPSDPDGQRPPEFDADGLEVTVDGDSIVMTAPADETWIRLLDAGATLGGIGHVDPRLGLLELIVRFEGGPSCSVLLTLQGRSHGTEVFCEMESIEAAPTPPIGPVLDALVAALGDRISHPPPGPLR